MENSDKRVRLNAIMWLGWARGEAKEEASHLVKLLHCSDKEIAGAAADALIAIAEIGLLEEHRTQLRHLASGDYKAALEELLKASR
mgnify:CR=1 FL=1